MTLTEVLHRRDDALIEILDILKNKKLYGNLWVQLKFFWQDTKREIYCATPWKDAQGDDLPEYERDVIALEGIIDPTATDCFCGYKVVFAHRPTPDGYDGKSIATGTVEHYTPKTYGEGGWSVPNIAYWLDIELPKEIEL